MVVSELKKLFIGPSSYVSKCLRCEPLTCLFPLFSLCNSNNVVLETGDKYSLNEDGSELVIKDVKKVDEGDYTCIAKNKAGEKAEEVSLNVFGKRVTPFAYSSIKEQCGFFFFFFTVSGLFFCTY